MIIHDPSNLVENETATFRCKAKFGGSKKLSIDYILHLKMFWAHDPYQTHVHPTFNINELESHMFIKVGYFSCT